MEYCISKKISKFASAMKKKIESSAFWKKVRFKYKLFFLNENTLEEVFAFRVSLWSGFWSIMAFAVVLITLTSIVIINTPIRNYLPGYMDAEIRQTMILNALKTDSLEQIIHVQSQYINNVSDLIRGNSPIDKVTQLDSLSTPVSFDDLKASTGMQQFIRDYEKKHPKKKE